MNYISHHEVARQYDSNTSPDFMFGSIIADLARMSKTKRYLYTVTNSKIQAGNSFHKLTNKVFDAHPEIKSIEDRMKNAFKEFLPLRTAIQASRAGKDLLFDGIQFNDNQVVHSLMTTLDRVINGEVAFDGVDEPTPLMATAMRLRVYGAPRYDDPAVVAKALQKVLSETRTQLESRSLNDVQSVLETYQPVILAIGSRVMEQTVSQIRFMDLDSSV